MILGEPRLIKLILRLHLLRVIIAKKFSIGKEKMRIIRFIMTLILVSSLAACAAYDFSRRIVQQGNLLPQNKIERLKIGMSKKDVAILMGTSLLSPLFNQDRWDYAYTLRQGNAPLEKRYVSLYFKQDRLARIAHQP